MEHLARFHFSSLHHRNRPQQFARSRTSPDSRRYKTSPRLISGVQNEDSQGKSSLAYTSASPQKAVIIFLGTGWQRFRFRLGRPRAEAHVWGKGARILTEINRLPQMHRLAPAQNLPKFSRDVPL